MRWVLSGAFFALWTVCAAAQFADANLEAGVRDALHKPTGSLTQDDLASLKYLDVSERDIERLDGIEQCIQLETLIAYGNRITNIEPLRSMTSLTFINLEENEIEDISPLLDIPGLSDVNVFGNPLSIESLCTDTDTFAAHGVAIAYEEPDDDSDNLYTCGEVANGSDPNNPDTDGDGIADGYEVEYGLDPTDSADALEDPDGDGLTNLDEFWLRGDPHASASPYATVYVSQDGSDDAGNGTAANPWRTIYHAMGQISPTETFPVTVLLMPGEYEETIVLKPYVRLQGPPSGGQATVEGAMVGAEGALLQYLALEQPDDKQDNVVLLELNNVAMQIGYVAFLGTGATSRATGIAVRGDGPGRALVTDCTFSGLYRGMEIFGALPTVRRCAFTAIVENGIVIRALAGKAAVNGSLGNVYNANTGWNTFQGVGGYDVVNERTQTITMQNNGWGADDPSTRISGPINYDPPLASGSSLVPASVVCTVWDTKDKTPITKGSVQVTPGTYLPATDNANGVYTLACLAAGNYAVGVSATGYHIGSRDVTAKSGEVTAIVVPVKALGTSEGEGEGESEGEGEGETPHSCVGGTIDAAPPRGPWRTGDGLALLAVAAILMAAAAGLDTARRTQPE